MSKTRLPIALPPMTCPQEDAAFPSTSWQTSPMMMAQMAGGGGNALAQSLLGPAVSGALSACFGPGVSRVQLSGGEDTRNREIGALASAEGRRVSLSSAIDPARGDRQSLEVLGHEIAHALAGGGSGATDLDQPGDPGEARADQAGQRFAAYVQGGMRGPAPKIPAATGGRARIHRWEGAEHRDAVDGAVALLPKETVNPEVASNIQQPVTLGNGLTLTPGQVTALMGDFYGVVDEQGQVDPEASFDAIWNADPEEMQGLLNIVAVESPDNEIAASTWECATAGRESSGELTYMGLAERNDSHFSAPEMSGTDNNMGTYAALHAMALEKAAEGTPEAANQARAMEAAAMHYLTDRHSGGHTFEKGAMMEATAHDPRGKLANGHAKWTHDQMNASGVEVSRVGTEQFPADTWRAYGDGRWHVAADDENRLRTAESVYTSYQELTQVLSGKASAEELAQTGYAALNTVPQWSNDRQTGVERGAELVDGLVGGDAAIATEYAGNILDLMTGTCDAPSSTTTSTTPALGSPTHRVY